MFKDLLKAFVLALLLTAMVICTVSLFMIDDVYTKVDIEKVQKKEKLKK